MQIKFSDTRPSDARLVAHIVDKGKMPSGLESALVAGAAAARFKGITGQLFDSFVERGGQAVRIALAGAGDAASNERHANCEKAGAAITARFLTSGASEVVVDLADSGLDASQACAVLLGLRLRAWRYDVHRTRIKDEEKITLAAATVVGAPEGTETAWADCAALAEGVEFTRELVAEPANVIYPVSFVERCEERFAGTGARITVLDVPAMEKLGMGALLGVGLGSEQPSRLLAIEWTGGGDEKPVAFVGKGVTFDTGGISLKPGPGMWDMKWDMGGAGAVAGAMLALVKRKAKANIVAVMGLVENMPDGKAQRPGDIVTSMSGQTIEVLNTDAEGRLVLCDALHWVQVTHSPAKIVNFATLTGAMVIALGTEHGGLFANNDALADELLAAGRQTGDKLWRMPLDPAYDKLIDSPISDMKNIGPREAGSITAAQFLKRFIMNDTPWAHCDIAGTVWSEKPGRTWGKGATGYGARLIDQFVRNTMER
jgi:leucyl aminopeptidase